MARRRVLEQNNIDNFDDLISFNNDNTHCQVGNSESTRNDFLTLDVDADVHRDPEPELDNSQSLRSDPIDVTPIDSIKVMFSKILNETTATRKEVEGLNNRMDNIHVELKAKIDHNESQCKTRFDTINTTIMNVQDSLLDVVDDKIVRVQDTVINKLEEQLSAQNKKIKELELRTNSPTRCSASLSRIDPTFYKIDIEPFTNRKDSIMPIAFIKNFELAIEGLNLSDKEKVRLFKSKIKDQNWIMSFEDLTYEKVKAQFLDTFWNDNTQNILLQEFLRATYDKRNTYVEFGRYWFFKLQDTETIKANPKLFYNTIISKLPFNVGATLACAVYTNFQQFANQLASIQNLQRYGSRDNSLIKTDVVGSITTNRNQNNRMNNTASNHKNNHYNKDTPNVPNTSQNFQ